MAKQFRNFELVVYPAQFEFVVNKCKDIQVQYLYVLHNKDVDGGIPKTEHYHFHVYFPSDGPVYTFKSISIMFNDYPLNLIQKVKNKKAGMRYLIHLDNPEKFPYKTEDVHGTKKALNDFKKATDDNLVDEPILIVQALSTKEFVSKTDFVLWADEAKIMKFVTSHWAMCMNLLDEHNMYYRAYKHAIEQTDKNTSLDGLIIDTQTGEVGDEL